MTFSILGISRDKEQIGIAIQSKFPGVASNAIFGRGGVGVVATQGFSNPEHAEKALNLLEMGLSPRQIVNAIVDNDEHSEQRQLAILSASGESATFTGKSLANFPGNVADRTGVNCVGIGNLLASSKVADEMINGFEADSGDLTERLINSLHKAQLAGGEIRGMQAAGVLVFQLGAGFQGHGSKLVDISVYDNPDPINELARCYGLHKLSYHPSSEKNLRPIVPDYCDEIRQILLNKKFLRADDTDNNEWGEAENLAFADFLGFENYDGRIRSDGLIDLEVLADIRSKHSKSN